MVCLMEDHVRELVGKVAEEISKRNGSCSRDNNSDDNWIKAERKVERYVKLMGWSDPQNDIAWHLDCCSLPAEYNNGNRREKAWEYTVMDVFQRPLAKASMN